MVGKKFSQLKLGGKRSFELSERDISVKELGFFEQQEYRIPFELLGDKRFEITTYSKVAAWSTLIMICIFLLFFITWITKSDDFALIIAVLMGIITFFVGLRLFLSWQKLVVYGGEGSNVVFYADVPSKEQVDAFIADIEQCKKEYLLQKYSYAAESNSIADQMLKLTWLKNSGALSEDEFNRIKQRVIDGFEVDGNFSL
jgi:hypothetical protein